MDKMYLVALVSDLEHALRRSMYRHILFLRLR